MRLCIDLPVSTEPLVLFCTTLAGDHFISTFVACISSVFGGVARIAPRACPLRVLLLGNAFEVVLAEL